MIHIELIQDATSYRIKLNPIDRLNAVLNNLMRISKANSGTELLSYINSRPTQGSSESYHLPPLRSY